MSKNFEIKKMEADLIYKEKNIILAYALWLFGSAFGLHRFYLGSPVKALIMLLLYWVGIFTTPFLIGFPLLAIFGIWWLADGYFVNKLVNEHNEKTTMKKISYLEKVEEIKVEEKVTMKNI